MLTLSIILYSIVAIIGVYLFIKLFSKTPSKLVIGIIHGALGLLGIAFLIIYTSFTESRAPVESILLFLTAFLIGGGIFFTKINEKKFPMWIVFLHILIAVAGLYFLFGAISR